MHTHQLRVVPPFQNDGDKAPDVHPRMHEPDSAHAEQIHQCWRFCFCNPPRLSAWLGMLNCCCCTHCWSAGTGKPKVPLYCSLTLREFSLALRMPSTEAISSSWVLVGGPRHLIVITICHCVTGSRRLPTYATTWKLEVIDLKQVTVLHTFTFGH